MLRWWLEFYGSGWSYGPFVSWLKCLAMHTTMHSSIHQPVQPNMYPVLSTQLWPNYSTIHPCNHPPIYWKIDPSMYPTSVPSLALSFICLFIRLAKQLSVLYLSIQLAIHKYHPINPMPMYPNIHLFVHPPNHWSIHIHPSIHTYIPIYIHTHIS